METEQIEPELPEPEPIDGILALRLNDLATSSRLGMADKAFPSAMRQLAALGFAAATEGDGGYLITPAGRIYLNERRRRKPNE